MIKKSLSRGAVSFSIGVVLAIMVNLIMTLAVNDPDFIPLVPSYYACFKSTALALNTYYLLVGVISFAFGCCSVIFEFEKWTYRKQGIVHFAITTAVWFPLASFLWGMFTYPKAMVNTFVSMSITYGIIWFIQYRICKKSIREINAKLQQMQNEG